MNFIPFIHEIYKEAYLHDINYNNMYYVGEVFRP